MLKFRCPNCQKGIAGKPELAGKKVACPHCKSAIVVPSGPGQLGQQTSPGAVPPQHMTGPMAPQWSAQPAPQYSPAPLQPGYSQQPSPMQPGYPQQFAPQQSAPFDAMPGGDPLFGGGDLFSDPLGGAMGMQSMPSVMPGGMPMQTGGFPSFGQPGGRARGKRSSQMLVIAVTASIGGILLLGLIGGGVYFLVGGGSSPKQAFLQMINDAKNQQFGKVWDALDNETQVLAGTFLPMAANAPGMSGLNLSGKTPREQFIAIAEFSVKQNVAQFSTFQSQIERENIADDVAEEVKGSTAVLTLKDSRSPQTQKLHMVKENGRWKLAIAKTIKEQFGNLPIPPTGAPPARFP